MRVEAIAGPPSLWLFPRSDQAPSIRTRNNFAEFTNTRISGPKCSSAAWNPADLPQIGTKNTDEHDEVQQVDPVFQQDHKSVQAGKKPISIMFTGARGMARSRVRHQCNNMMSGHARPINSRLAPVMLAAA